MLIKILFLDLNGTVIDDWDSSYVGVQAIFKKYQTQCPSLDTYIRKVALTGDYHGFYIDNGVKATRDDLYEIYTPSYRKHAGEAVVMPNVHDALEAIKSLGVEIHLLTAARKDFAEVLVKQANISQFCDAFHYHVHNKSAQIHAVIDGMDVLPQECAMIGDLPSDVRHAKKVGVKGIAFLNRHVPRDLFGQIHDMDFATDSFEGLLQFVLQS